MPKRNFPTGLLIVCITLLVALALVRDDLCEVQYQDGTQLFKAVLAYEVRESSVNGGASMPHHFRFCLVTLPMSTHSFHV
ncbi:Hok/Gef family protein [Photobacterium leiognathi]|uniref:Hok/Gef family protein n=1 Tax=Photobacterium leiognathi TaxID=553611 RepID=UPI0009E62AC6|nr:Hok/Gef family protein [Photobacterium leiognathi]